MPVATLMQDIPARYDSLTKAEKKVADVVLGRPQEALRATITELSELCGVGETSVFRFCRSMKLDGYQDFKLSLALSTGTSEGLPGLPAAPGGADVPAQVYRATAEALEAAWKSLDPAAVDETVALMLAAQSVHFFGSGGSGLSALEAYNKFLKIMPGAGYTSDTHMQLTTASLLGPRALAVIFSNSGTTKAPIAIARLARESGAKVVFITTFKGTPAGRYCDVILPCGAHEGPMEGGSIAAKTAQLYLVNLLYTLVFRRMGEDAVRNKTITAGSIIAEML